MILQPLVPAGLPYFNPIQSGSMRNAAAAVAAYLDPVAEIRDTRGNVLAAQSSGASRPLALPCYAGDDHYLHIPGVAGNYASIPAEAGMSALTTFTADFLVSLPTNFRPPAIITLGAKYDTGANQREFRMVINTSGGMVLTVSGNGTTASSATSSANITGAANSFLWLRYVRDSGVARFYTCPASNANPSDGLADWTTLGVQQTLTGVVTTFTSAAPYVMGSSLNSGVSLDPMSGRMCRARFYNAANGGGTKLFDVDYRIQTHGVTAITATTGQTVTIAQSGVNPAGLIGASVLQFDGVDDFLDLDATFLSYFNNKSNGYLAAVYRDTNQASTTSHPVVYFSSNVASGGRFGIFGRTSAVNGPSTSGRRLDADTLVSVTSVDSGYRVLAAKANWAQDALVLRVNASQIGTVGYSSGAGSTSATDSAVARIGRADTAYFPGRIGMLAFADRAVTDLESLYIEKAMGPPYGQTI